MINLTMLEIGYFAQSRGGKAHIMGVVLTYRSLCEGWMKVWIQKLHQDLLLSFAMRSSFLTAGCGLKSSFACASQRKWRSFLDWLWAIEKLFFYNCSVVLKISALKRNCCIEQRWLIVRMPGHLRTRFFWICVFIWPHKMILSNFMMPCIVQTTSPNFLKLKFGEVCRFVFLDKYW